MKRVFLVVALTLALAAPALAQPPAPNREKDVKDLVDKYRGLLTGDDDKGRVVTGLICNDLNRLDAGQWGMLIKNDRNPPFVPYDILVWKPTREHFDVLSGLNSTWIPDGPIRSTWDPVPCPLAVPDAPPPVVVPPPVVIVPPPVVIPPPVTAPPVDLNAAALAEIKALATEAVQEIKAHRAAVSREYYKWAAILGPILTGLFTWMQLRAAKPL